VTRAHRGYSTPRRTKRPETALMVQPALIAAPIGAAAAVVVATRAVLGGRQSKEEVRRGVVDDNEVSFACERVCASDRLMSRLGGLGKVRRRCS